MADRGPDNVVSGRSGGDAAAEVEKLVGPVGDSSLRVNPASQARSKVAGYE